ncbi:hypothetical protein JCM8547_002563 [Rhodosporidiobolus lusitaniae]
MSTVLEQASEPLPPQPASQRRRSSTVLPSDYFLDVRQQPRQARMAGSGEKADRRPIDPPPIIRLRIRKPHARRTSPDELAETDLVTPTLTHTLFMFASLIPENSEEELFDIEGSKTKLVAGSVVSSLFHLKDQSCFVFPDLSVRTEGRWRFKMSLFELGEDGVHFCTSIVTDTFQVYSSKRFPGMGKSTELSKSFAQQGLKLRIRRPGSKTADDDGDDEPAPRVASRKSASRPSTAVAAKADFAPPPSRRPPAPVASTSTMEHPSNSRKRPYTAAGHGPAPPAHHVHPHPHAYAPYPSRLSASVSDRTNAPPYPHAVDGRHLTAHPHAHPSHEHHAAPPSAYPPRAHAGHTIPRSQHHHHHHPHHHHVGHRRLPSYPPPTSFSHPAHVHTSASASSLASHSLSHPHSHHSLSPPMASTPYYHAPNGSTRHFPPPLSSSSAQAHHPHRFHSPPPILAPIRSLPSSFNPPSQATQNRSPPAPAAPAQQPRGEYDAATVAAGAALAALCGDRGRPRRMTESSVRSTGSDEEREKEEGKAGEEVEMQDAPPLPPAEATSPAPSVAAGGKGGGSLAMLLGESAQDAKMEANREGVDFF